MTERMDTQLKTCCCSFSKLSKEGFEGSYQSPAPPDSRLLAESPLLPAAAEAKLDVNGEGISIV